jgi:hypothetical protein
VPPQVRVSGRRIAAASASQLPQSLIAGKNPLAERYTSSASALRVTPLRPPVRSSSMSRSDGYRLTGFYPAQLPKSSTDEIPEFVVAASTIVSCHAKSGFSEETCNRNTNAGRSHNCGSYFDSSKYPNAAAILTLACCGTLSKIHLRLDPDWQCRILGSLQVARNPFNPQPLIYHLTNSRRCGIL